MLLQAKKLGLMDGRGAKEGVKKQSSRIVVTEEFNHIVLSHFYSSFSRPCYFFECVQLVRKSFLTGVIVMFYEEGGMRIAAAFLASVAYLILLVNIEPMNDRYVYTLEQVGALGLVLTLFGTMLMKYLACGGEVNGGILAQEHAYLGGVVTFINAAVLALAALLTVTSVFSMFTVSAKGGKKNLNLAGQTMKHKIQNGLQIKTEKNKKTVI